MSDRTLAEEIAILAGLEPTPPLMLSGVNLDTTAHGLVVPDGRLTGPDEARLLKTLRRNLPTILAALRAQAAADGRVEAMREGAAERVCHDEQMTIWTGEIAGRLSMGEYLRENLSYDDVVCLHAALACEVRRIVASAFRHPELSALPSKEAETC